MGRLESIRAAEAKSHTEVYARETLYEGSSWLKKPIRTVLELLPNFEGRKSLRVLDLGCGIGRNCIPIAQKFHAVDCRIDCVDILDLAIEQLREYSKKYGVEHCINGIVAPLEDYDIREGEYDLILAVSALEHVKSEEVFGDMLRRISAGVRTGGIVCLVINSNISEADKETGAECEVQFEVNLSTENLEKQLCEKFMEWEILKTTVVPQEYDIMRDRLVHLTTDVVTWVARKTLPQGKYERP